MTLLLISTGVLSCQESFVTPSSEVAATRKPDDKSWREGGESTLYTAGGDGNHAAILETAGRFSKGWTQTWHMTQQFHS